MSGSDWELLIRIFIACTPSKGRTAPPLTDDLSFLMAAMAVSSTDFAFFALNDVRDKSRLASCTRASNADGEDADTDRGEDENDDADVDGLEA